MKLNNNTFNIDKEVRTGDVITPTERLINGNLAAWSTTVYPDSWGMYTPSDGLPTRTLFQRSSTAYAGTYAMELEVGTSELISVYSSNILISYSALAGADETIQATLYARRSTGTANVGLIYICEYGGDSYIYNFTGAESGTWTSDIAAPTTDQVEIKTLTSSYVLQTFTSATVPDEVDVEAWANIFALGTTGHTILIDNHEILVAGANAASNTTFEAWTTDSDQSSSTVTSFNYYNGFGYYDWIEPTQMESSYILRDDSDKPAGMTYSAKMYIGDAPENQDADHRQYIDQAYTGTIGVSLETSIWHKNGIGYIFFINGTTAGYTQVWNKTTNVWVNHSGTAITDFPEGTADYFQATESDGSWTEYTDTVTIPASGIVRMVCLSNKSAVATPLICSWGDLSMSEDVVTPGIPINMDTLTNPSAYADLDSTDTIFKREVSDKVFVHLKGDGKYYTGLADFDYSTSPVAVGNATDADHAYTKSQSDTAISTAVTNGTTRMMTATDLSPELNQLILDETITGYTVPTGYTFHSYGYITEITESSGAGMSAIVNHGDNNPSYNNGGALQTPNAVVGAIGAYSLDSTTKNFTSGTAIMIKVTSVATGYTVLKTKYRLVGFLTLN